MVFFDFTKHFTILKNLDNTFFEFCEILDSRVVYQQFDWLYMRMLTAILFQW